MILTTGYPVFYDTYYIHTCDGQYSILLTMISSPVMILTVISCIGSANCGWIFPRASSCCEFVCTYPSGRHGVSRKCLKVKSERRLENENRLFFEKYVSRYGFRGFHFNILGCILSRCLKLKPSMNWTHFSQLISYHIDMSQGMLSILLYFFNS